MPLLLLKFNNNVIREFTLSKDQSATIGRREDNDIVIENLAVSSHHARVDAVGNGYLLTDLQSKNGSIVNETLVASHWLNHGDVINIGKHFLEFRYTDQEERPPAATDARDRTMVMDTHRYRDMLAAGGGAGRPQPAAGPVGVISFLAGGEGEMELSRKLVKIGKDPGSDIVVSGLTVGATAATISKRPNGYHLSYVSGLSKPRINGKSVKESVPLKEFDVIEIGSARMQFFTKE
jgi:pSer/pThr/pTyr-binding forkhead associated (FHA) protein